MKCWRRGLPLANQAFSIADFFRLPVGEALPLLVDHPALPAPKRRLARQVLHALNDVGLGYLPLGQPSPTLSGGESQRVKLARYLGQRSLAGELLVLDEPSTGLHPQDIAGLLVVLHRLVRGGATIVVVEHNLDIIRAADWIIDLGPGAGPEGGRLLYAGPPDGLLQAAESQTGLAIREEDALRAARQAGPNRPNRKRGGDPHPRGAGQQPARCERGYSQRRADRGDRCLRLGEVQPGQRCAGGGSAPALSGEPVDV